MYFLSPSFLLSLWSIIPLFIIFQNRLFLRSLPLIPKSLLRWGYSNLNFDSSATCPISVRFTYTHNAPYLLYFRISAKQMGSRTPTHENKRQIGKFSPGEKKKFEIIVQPAFNDCLVRYTYLKPFQLSFLKLLEGGRGRIEWLQFHPPRGRGSLVPLRIVYQ